ncbi:Phosphoribosylformylglycinamidine synthase subunit PurQ [uncultured archaeon]|nr:Phosphoribosylformylglycinamidine synthase subunit PurQ [uncultured archaeon]
MTDAAVLLIEGTNCEEEMWHALTKAGLSAEKVHLKQFTGDCPPERRRRLSDYSVLMIPGGWSAGDYIRAGAIFAARIKSRLLPELKEFVKDGRPVGGICNGFQVLVEAGMLPAFKGITDVPDAVLSINMQNRFECRPTYLRLDGNCAFTGRFQRGSVIQVPVAHGEGRLEFGGRSKEALKLLSENGQVVFRYCMPDGAAAGGFPWNPNGSLDDIAGICNPEGNVLGMMPHPERVVSRIQHADWTRTGNPDGLGDGFAVFQSLVDYLKKKK